MIVSDRRDCEVYFSTDGQPPNLSSHHWEDVERTFKYCGPFQLQPGRRTIMAIAVNRCHHWGNVVTDCVMADIEAVIAELTALLLIFLTL